MWFLKNFTVILIDKGVWPVGYKTKISKSREYIFDFTLHDLIWALGIFTIHSLLSSFFFFKQNVSHWLWFFYVQVHALWHYAPQPSTNGTYHPSSTLPDGCATLPPINEWQHGTLLWRRTTLSQHSILQTIHGLSTSLHPIILIEIHITKLILLDCLSIPSNFRCFYWYIIIHTHSYSDFLFRYWVVFNGFVCWYWFVSNCITLHYHWRFS